MSRVICPLAVLVISLSSSANSVDGGARWSEVHLHPCFSIAQSIDSVEFVYPSLLQSQIESFAHVRTGAAKFDTILSIRLIIPRRTLMNPKTAFAGVALEVSLAGFRL